MRHRLTQDRVPRARRQAAIEPLPRFTAVATAKDGRFPFDTRARPHGSAIHRNNPDGFVVFGMAGHGKTDIADLFRHVVPDALPALLSGAILPVEPVNTAMILVIPAARICRMNDCVMRIVSVFVFTPVFFGRREIHRNAAVHGPPRITEVVRQTQAATGEAEQQPLRIGRVHLNRVALLTIRSSRSEVVAPLGKRRMVIETGDTVPGDSIILAFEEPYRTRAGKPHAGLTDMTGRQEKNVIQCESLPARVVRIEGRVRVCFLGLEARGLFRFLPVSSTISGPIDRRSEMTGAHRREQRLSTSRILHDMMNLHPKEPRLVQPAFAVAVPERPCPLSCTQDPCIRPFWSNRLRHLLSSFSRFLSLKTNERLRNRHLYEQISKISCTNGKWGNYSRACPVC